MGAGSTRMLLQRTTENEDFLNEETKSKLGARDMGALSEGEAARKASEEAPPVTDQDTEKINSITAEVDALKENQELLVTCISQDLGYVRGKPVAACLIYKCLLHWRSFEIKETNIFHRIVQFISSVIKVKDNNDVLAYWLSNLAVLLCLLQRAFSSSTILIKGYMGEVEAKYPALLFRQQLISLLEQIYGMIIDNFKKEILPLLGLCITPSRKSSLVKETPEANAEWQSIKKKLNAYLNLMKANNVPPLLVGDVFTKIFSFINVKIFNSFLLRRELCTSSNGKYFGAGLAVLKQWCVEATDEYVGLAWDELRHVRQAAEFMQVIHRKRDMTLEEITRELCPVLSMKQLFRISVMYWDDKYSKCGVSSHLVEKMRIMLADDSDIAMSGFLMLDEEDSSLPFTVEDISKSMQKMDVNDIEPLQLIRESPGFSFLFTREDSS